MISKPKNLQVHHAFLYIPLRSLNDYDLETASFHVFRGGREQKKKKMNFLISFFNLDVVL